MIILLITLLAISLCFIITGLLLETPRLPNESSSKKSVSSSLYRPSYSVRKMAIHKNRFKLRIKVIAILAFISILCLVLFIFTIRVLQKPDILRDPIWQFVGVIISLVSLIVSIIPSILKSKREQEK